MAKRSQLPKSGGARPYKAAPKKPESRGLLLGIVAGVLVVAVGLILLAVQSLNKPVQSTGRVGEGSAWGPVDAPVQVIDYSDFGCSHCANFAQGAGAQLRDEYEAGGKVRFEFRHFIVGGPKTADAANASECAADQGRFWDYHDVLFSRQATSADPFNKTALKGYATSLGLDTAAFNQCVDSDTHLEAVYRDASEGRTQGVQATPTFFINGEKIEGAIPYASLKSTVEGYLASAE